SALTRATADAALLGGDLAVLPWAQGLAREVIERLRGNLRFAVLYNAIGMSLAAAGMLHPVVAALLMLGSSAWVSWRAARPLQGYSPDSFPARHERVAIATPV